MAWDKQFPSVYSLEVIPEFSGLGPTSCVKSLYSHVVQQRDVLVESFTTVLRMLRLSCWLLAGKSFHHLVRSRKLEKNAGSTGQMSSGENSPARGSPQENKPLLHSEDDAVDEFGGLDHVSKALRSFGPEV